jgi:hypothetical protein
VNISQGVTIGTRFLLSISLTGDADMEDFGASLARLRKNREFPFTKRHDFDVSQALWSV